MRKSSRKRARAKQPRRDHKAEYRRRIKKGMAKGLTRSQARGHVRPYEANSSSRRPKTLKDAVLQAVLRGVQRGDSQTTIARQNRISPERLRRILSESRAVERHGRRLVVRKEAPREVLIYSDGRALIITVPDLKTAAVVGSFMSHVRIFLTTNNPKYLSLFKGGSVTDIGGTKYEFETNPEVLYELAHAGDQTFEDVYRYVV